MKTLLNVAKFHVKSDLCLMVCLRGVMMVSV